MKYAFLALKLLLSIILIYFFISKIDYRLLLDHVNSPNGIKAILAAIGICMIQAILGGLRLVYILKLYKCIFGVFECIRIWLIGAFFSQIMVSFIGGDAIRIFCLSKSTLNLRSATSAILLDRVIGFIALSVIFLSVLPFLLSVVTANTMRMGIISLSIISGLMCFLFFAFGAMPVSVKNQKYIGTFFDICFNSRYLFSSIKHSSVAFLLSVCIHFTNIISIYSIFYLNNIDVNFFWCVALATPAMLISMLPISIAGWGVRESAMIMGFSIVGIPSESVLAVSVIFGLGQFFAGIPGAALFLLMRGRQVSLPASTV